MLKILLVYDDFQELTSVELMLKKIGFDVVGITSEFSLAEQLLSFNPQIVVAQGRTAKVSTANVGRRLRESSRWDGQSVLIFYSNAKPQPTELLRIRMDVGLEYPVEPTKMVQVLAQLGSLDANQLIDKLIKSMATEPNSTGGGDTSFSNKAESDAVFVSGGKQLNDKSAPGYVGSAGKDIRGSQANTTGGAAGADQQRTALTGNAGAAQDTRSALSGADTQTSTQNNVRGGSTAPAVNQDVAGARSTDSQDPLFPLNGKGEGNGDTSNANGKMTTVDTESVGVKGGFGNTFQLDNKITDPLMQELENLLQNKPALTLDPTPPLNDKARHKKYDEYMKTIPIQQLASIKRTQAKSRLRDLVKDIDKNSLEDQDVLRREYVKALFKKEG